MDGEHICEVSVYDEHGCDDSPSFAKVVFDKPLRDKIRRLMAVVNALSQSYSAFCIEIFDGHVVWLDEDKEEDNDIRMECEMLRVMNNSFCFRAIIKHTEIRVQTCDIYDPEKNGFFQPGDISKEEAIQAGIVDLLGLLKQSTKLQEAVTLAVIGEEVKRG